MNCHAQWKPVLMMVVINFGLATVIALLKKMLDEGINHLVLITYRLSVSAISLAPIAYFWERQSRPKLTSHILCQLFFSALIGITLAQYLLLLGLEYTSATFSSAFSNMVPVCTFLFSLLFGLEKVNMKSLGGRTKLLGTFVCIGGTVLLTLYKGKPLAKPLLGAKNHIINHKTEKWVIGSIFSIAGSTLWSSWFIMQSRIGKQYPCQYSSTAIMSFFGAIQSSILSLIIERNLTMWVLKGKLEIISVIYAGLVGSALAYVGMSWCVKQRGPVFTSAFIPLTQIIVAMFDFSVLHERIYLGSVVGSIIVIIGLYFLLWGKSKEIEECDHQIKQLQVAQQGEHSNAAALSLAAPITVYSTRPSI